VNRKFNDIYHLYRAKNRYVGPVQVLYHLFPVDVFGNKIFEVSLRALDFQDYPKNVIANKKDKMRINEECPESFKLFAILGTNDECKYKFIDIKHHQDDESIFKVDIGEKIAFGVQILDAKKRKVIAPPGIKKAAGKGYELSLKALRPAEGEEEVKDYGASFDLWTYSETDKKWNQGVKGNEVDRAYFYFQNISYSLFGKIFICCTVKYDSREIISAKFPIFIPAKKVHHMTIKRGSSDPIPVGCPLNVFTITFLDSNDRPTPVGRDIEVSIVSDNFTVPIIMTSEDGVDREDDTPAFEMKEEDAETSIDLHQFIARPKSKNLFPRGIFQLKENLVVHVKYDEAVGIPRLPVCSPVGIEFSFIPGPPKRILPLEDVLVEVINGEELPPLTFACYDEWRNVTAPGRGVDWKLRVDYKGNFRGEDSFSVNSGGEITLRGIVAEFDDLIQPDGVRLKIHCSLECRYVDGSHPEFEYEILVMPAFSITSLQVLQNGNPIPVPFVVEAGSIISGLSLILVDDRNQPVEITASMFANSSFISESWNAKRKTLRGPKAAKPALTDILIEEKIPHRDKGRIDFNVDISISDIPTLSFDFSVTVVPSSPTKWKIFTDNIDMGIIAGDPHDLSQKIRLLSLVDNFDNLLSVKDNDTAPMFAVGIRGNNSRKRVLKMSGHLESKSKRHEEQENDSDHSDHDEEGEFDSNYISLPLIKAGYSLSASRFLEPSAFTDDKEENSIVVYVVDIARMIAENSFNCLVPETVPSFISFRLSDEFDAFEAETKTVGLVGGLPSKVLVKVEKNDLYADDYTRPIEILTFERVPVRIEVCDKNNFSSMLSNVKSAKLVAVARFCLEGRTFETLCLPKKKISHPEVPVEISIPTIIEKLLLAINQHVDAEDPGEGSSSRKDVNIDQVAVSFSFSFITGEKNNLVETNLDDTVITFSVIKTKRIIDIDTFIVPAESQMSESAEVLKSYEACVLDGFPVVNILPRSENGIQADISLDSLSYSLSVLIKDPKSTKKVKKSLTFEDYFDAAISDSATLIALKPRFDAVENISVGTFLLTVTYTERRPDVLAMLPESDKTVSTELKITLNPGPPAEIYIDEKSLEKFNNLTVSNSSMASCRKIMDGIAVHLLDSRRNKASLTPEFTGNYRVACRISEKPPSLSQASRENRVDVLPQLHGASAKGILLSDPFDIAKGHFYFPKLELLPSVGSGEGQLKLDFIIVFVNDESVASNINVEDRSIVFYFTSDESKALRKQSIREKLAPLQDAIKNYDREIQGQKLGMREIREEIKKLLLNATSAQLLIFKDEPDRFTQSECRRIQPEIERQLEDMHRAASAPRAAAKRANFPNLAALEGFDTLGLVTDLGFVSDYKQAFILSWAAGSYMDTLVVQDSKTAMKLYEKNIKVWALSDVVPYSSDDRYERSCLFILH